MFQTICDLIPWDADASPRARRLELMRRVLDGTLYDALPYEFHDERSPSGEYIPLRRRRPSVRYALARVVVEDSVALLFSEGHFPGIASPDAAVRDALQAVARDCRLNQVMTEAAIRGSVGSCCLLLRVLQGRVFVDVLDTTWLTPVWQADAPDVLASVTERYKVPGRELLALGYDVSDPGAAYWFQRRWDAQDETWFVPQAVGVAGAPAVDAGRSVRHGLGLVPLVWIRNLPGGVAPDGACTFRSAVETGIEIDYQLSQAGRGLKYSSDPTLLIKEPAGLEGELVRGAGNALVVNEKGDARLLEIGGTAAGAVLDYVRVLRDLALEGVHGNRADPSRLGAPQSGRGAGADEPGAGLVGGQPAGFLWRGRAAAGAAADPAGGAGLSVAGGGAAVGCVGPGGATAAGLAALVSRYERGPGAGCGDYPVVGTGRAAGPQGGAAAAGGGLERG